MSIPEQTLVALRETNDFFCDCIRRRDTDAFNRVYTSNALILPPNTSAVNGLNAIQAFWKRAMDAFDVKDATLTTISAEQAGDTVVEIGRCELILADGLILPGKYVVHWKQDAGTWKWNTDIWNMNQ